MKTQKYNTRVEFNIILEAICDYFKLDDPFIIFNVTRKKEIIFFRQWFHYFARTLNPSFYVTNEEIGRCYSDITGRSYSHCTIIHSVTTINNLIDVETNYKKYRKGILDIIVEKNKHTFNAKKLHKNYKYHLQQARFYRKLIKDL